MKRISVFLIAFVLLFCFSAYVYASEADYHSEYDPSAFSDFSSEELTLYAKSAVLTDAKTGRILFGKEADLPMANASTTKIMTCILALENASMDETVTVSAYAASMPEVSLGFLEDDTFRLGDLLYSLMLESHNDSAVAIAEHISGNVEAFAEAMNRKAAEIGCRNCHFVTPNGLDQEDEGGMHAVSAYDLSLIMSYCIQNPAFVQITQTQEKQISDLTGNRSYSLQNHNALLQLSDAAVSGKTGYTAKAGYCYVGAVQVADNTYTFALLACGWPNHKNYKWEDSKKLIQYVTEHCKKETLRIDAHSKEIPVGHAVSSAGGKFAFPDTVTASAQTDEMSAVLTDFDQMDVLYEIPKYCEAPVREGEQAGYEIVCLNGYEYARLPLYYNMSYERWTMNWCLKYFLHLFYL